MDQSHVFDRVKAWRLSALIAVTMALIGPGEAFAATSLNVLTWCDHEDPPLLHPFEKTKDVKVNFKDIDSTAAALAVLG